MKIDGSSTNICVIGNVLNRNVIPWTKPKNSYEGQREETSPFTQTGYVVNIQPNVKHSHGATKDKWFAAKLATAYLF